MRLARGGGTFTAKARVILQVMLWCAHKKGQGPGVKPHEAMFWKGQGELSALAHTYRENVQRSLREMGPEGMRLVRWKKVHDGELLPNGQKATCAVCVYVLDLDRLAVVLGVTRRRIDGEHLGAAYSVQDGDNVSPSMETKGSRSPANFSMKMGSPIDPMISDLVNHGEPSSIRPPSPDDDFGQAPNPESAAVDEVVRYWLERIGRVRLAGNPSQATRTLAAVRTAVGRLVRRGISLGDLRLIVDARCDRAIGGAAFDWCEDPPRKQGRSAGPVWNAAIFGGCADHLLAEARSRVRAIPTVRPPSHRTDPSRVDPGDVATTPAMAPEEATRVAARLKSLLGVKVDPLTPPASIAAIRPARRR
jgi:hypothetical protein